MGQTAQAAKEPMLQKASILWRFGEGGRGTWNATSELTVVAGRAEAGLAVSFTEQQKLFQEPHRLGKQFY